MTVTAQPTTTTTPAATEYEADAVVAGRHDAAEGVVILTLSLGGRYTLSRWPASSSWDFVAVGRGHDVTFWAGFLAALEKIDPDMAVNIEHEDQELDQLDGLRFAAQTLLDATGRT